MKTRHFLNTVESQNLLAAIRAAEEGSTSDIVVMISPKKVDSALAEAETVFAKLRLEKSVQQNSLLIFVAPLSQTFAVVGGPALHAKVGQVWWDELAGVLGTHFKNARFHEGLLSALEIAGQAVKKHFPSSAPQDRSGQQDLLQE